MLNQHACEVYVSDTFGTAFFELFRLYEPDSFVQLVPSLESIAASAHTCFTPALVITSDPVIQSCYAISKQFALSGRKLLPLTCMHNSVWLGPFTEAPTEPCWGCLVARLSAQGTEMLEHSQEACRREMPFFVAGMWYALHHEQHRSPHPGTVWRWDLEAEAFSSQRLLGLDGCPVCGIQQNIQERGTVNIRKALSALLASHAPDEGGAHG